jgi:hypothetical protein
MTSRRMKTIDSGCSTRSCDSLHNSPMDNAAPIHPIVAKRRKGLRTSRGGSNRGVACVVLALAMSISAKLIYGPVSALRYHEAPSTRSRCRVRRAAPRVADSRVGRQDILAPNAQDALSDRMPHSRRRLARDAGHPPRPPILRSAIASSDRAFLLLFG